MSRRPLIYRDAVLKTLDASIGRLLCRVLGWRDYLQSRGRCPGVLPGQLTAAGKRVLFIRPGGMGDMILLLPAVSVLQKSYPDARIDILCERRNAEIPPLLQGFRGEILRYDQSSWRLWQKLRRNRYELVVDTEQFHHLSAVLARLSGADCRIGFKINPVRNPLYTHLINYAPDGPESAQFLRLLEPFGGIMDDAPAVEGILADSAAGIEPPAALPQPAAAVYAGAGTPYKQWPVERFCKVIEVITGELGLGVVLVGGAEAVPASRYIAERFSGGQRSSLPVCSMAGRTTVREAAAILRQASFFLGADCGLAHMAAAVGVPAVTLFGPSDPMKWGHDYSHHRVLHKGRTCSPCFIFGYHRLCRGRDCLRDITVDDVVTACRQVVKHAESSQA